MRLAVYDALGREVAVLANGRSPLTAMKTLMRGIVTRDYDAHLEFGLSTQILQIASQQLTIS